VKEDHQGGVVVVQERNLIMRRSAPSQVDAVIWQEHHVKNFKRFRKVINQLFVVPLQCCHVVSIVVCLSVCLLVCLPACLDGSW